MTLKSTTFKKSIRLKPDADTILSEEGTLKVDSGDNKLKAYLGAAIRALVSEDQSQTLTNKTIVVANNTITTAASGNLAAIELNAALSELQSDIDTRATSSSLSGHTGASSGVHGVVGSVVGTSDSQVLTNKTIDADLNTITNIENADIKSGAAIARDKLASGTANRVAVNNGSGVLSDAAAITAARALISDANGIPTHSSVTSTTLEFLDATSSVQTQINSKVTGPASATDNAVARFDLTTGKIIQNSSVIIDDASNVSGMASLTLDNLYLDQNTIENSLNNTDLNFNTQGSGQIVSQKTTRAKADVTFDITTDSTTTGADATLVDPATKIIRLTNASLASVAMIPAGLQGQQITIINHTGAIVTIKDNSGATAANRILTGQKASISLKDEASLILEYDSTESRWMVIGGTGSGDGSGINYITNSDMEAGVTGYSAYSDAAGVNPVDGTGGAPNVTVTATTSSPLRGAQSLLFTKDAANRQGQGFSFDFTISRADTNQLLDINFEYEIASGTYASANMGVFIYDVTNATLIQPIQIDIPGLSSGNTGRFQSQFQSTSSTSYRLIFHVRTTSASAYTLEVDTVKVSPSQSFVGTIITDPVSWTPTGSMNTNTTYTGRQWREGKFLAAYVKVSFSGAPNSTSLTINLPSGLSIDTTSLLTATSVNSFTLGHGNIYDTSAGDYADVTMEYSSTTALAVKALRTVSTANVVDSKAAVTQAVPFTLASGDSIEIYFKVPIQGWSAANAATQGFGVVPVATYVRSTAQSIPNTTFTTLLATTQFVDTTNSYNTSTGLYTVPEAGTYRIEATTLWAASPGSQSILRFQRNGGFTGVPQASDRSYDGANAHLNMNGFVIVQCAKGDTLNAQVYQSGGTVNVTGSVYISRIDKNMFNMVSGARTATISDVKASGTDGGSSTVSTWSTRTLNTLSDSTGIVTSLSSNQFVLPEGEYYIEAYAPSFQSNIHKARLRNITDSSTALVGSSEYSNSAASYAVTQSIISGRISITSAKTFEIQHNVGASKATNGFGLAGSFGENEIYTQVKITKLR